MATRNSYNTSVDWLTIIIYLLLVTFGWMNIYAANYTPDNTVFLDFSREHMKQIVWIGLSLVLIGMIFLIDSQFFVEFAYVFYGISIFLLVTVLLFGKEINGAKSWFEAGPVRFQPAELTKVATALALARLMSRFGFDISKPRNMFKIGFIIFTPVLMILLQNDTGSALVYFVFILVLYREGMTGYIIFFGFIAAIVGVLTLIMPNLYIFGLITATIIAALFFKGIRKSQLKGIIWGTVTGTVIFIVSKLLKTDLAPEYAELAGITVMTVIMLSISMKKRLKKVPLYLLILWGAISLAFTADYFFNKVLNDYQRTRINVLLGLEEDPLGAGYNVNQSKIAIGSGGFTGKGFLEGTQTKFDFVPEQSTDFIFCTVGEEWGFAGSMFVIIGFVTLILRLIFLAERQHSNFSRIYGYGVAAIFFFHFAINIGMTIGLAPVIGIPLPFFSYGGSSLWGFTLLLFIFLKLDTNRNELIR
jgi:rod shape determining protein RodA